MKRRLTLGLALVALAMFAAACGKVAGSPPPPQSHVLDAQTTVTFKDAWIFGIGTTNPLLRAKFVYEGRNPFDAYGLKATLRAGETNDEIKSIYVWNYNATPTELLPTNRLEVIWEFKYFPSNTPDIYFREYFLDQTNGQVLKFLDFVLPGTKDLRIRDAGTD